MKVILIYLFIMNAAGFLVMTADKLFAQSGAWRVPERSLLGISVIGGSIGVLLAMYTVRHKTQHLKFTLGIPAILALQVVIALWILIYM